MFPPQQKVKIYHITHHSNLPGIIECGGLLCDGEAARQGPVSIAYGRLKERRFETLVPCEPFGALTDYVPFYFAPRSPMLYAIHKGCVTHYTDGQSKIVYIVCSIQKVVQMGLRFVFTDGHPISRISRFANDLKWLGEMVDWRVMESTVWHNTPEDPDRKRRRQAEFLVYRFLPLEAVETIAVYDLDMRRQVQSYLGDPYQIDVVVRRAWYY
jgi:hypothetical protein